MGSEMCIRDRNFARKLTSMSDWSSGDEQKVPDFHDSDSNGCESAQLHELCHAFSFGKICVAKMIYPYLVACGISAPSLRRM